MRGLIITRYEAEALRSLTQNWSTSLLPIANRSLLAYQVDLLAGGGITEITVASQRGLEEELQGLLAGWEEVEFRLLAAGRDSLARELEPLFVSDPVVVLLGPLFTDLDLSRVLDFHRERESSATLILRSVGKHPQRSLVFTDDQCRVTRVLPPVPTGGRVAHTLGSLYIFEPQQARNIIHLLLAGKEEGVCLHLLEAGVPAYGFPVEGYWLQVENPAAYLQAHLDILSGRVKIKPPGREVAPGVWLGCGVKIAPKAKLEPPLILGDRVELKEGARVRESVLGAGTFVDAGAVVTGSVIQQNCYLGKGAQVEGAVLGEDTIVAKGALLCPGVLLASQSVISRGSLLGGAFARGQRQDREG